MQQLRSYETEGATTTSYGNQIAEEMERDIPSKVVDSWDGTLAQLTLLFIRQDQECLMHRFPTGVGNQ